MGNHGAGALLGEFHDQRIRRIRALAAELNEKCELNTEASRSRCARIASELLELFKAEEAHQRGLPLPIGRKPQPA